MYGRINAGLAAAYEKMLHTKAALGQTIVAADPDGKYIEVAASEILARNNSRHQSDK